jgi:hypothetical protein
MSPRRSPRILASRPRSWRAIWYARTAPFVDGNRVTVREVDVNRALGNQSLISRLRAGRTVDDYWSAIRGVPGLEVTLEPEITIEFEPER